MSDPISKTSHIGAPKVFLLEAACQIVNRAFGSFGCYHVGSSLERADWRDVDVRFIMPDEDFDRLFPTAEQHWEQDPRWILICAGVSQWLSQSSGLPVDFQIQRQSHANSRHNKRRHAIGLVFKASE